MQCFARSCGHRVSVPFVVLAVGAPIAALLFATGRDSAVGASLLGLIFGLTAGAALMITRQIPRDTAPRPPRRPRRVGLLAVGVIVATIAGAVVYAASALSAYQAAHMGAIIGAYVSFALSIDRLIRDARPS